jgi:hypothetical protein
VKRKVFPAPVQNMKLDPKDGHGISFLIIVSGIPSQSRTPVFPGPGFKKNRGKFWEYDKGGHSRGVLQKPVNTFILSLSKWRVIMSIRILRAPESFPVSFTVRTPTPETCFDRFRFFPESKRRYNAGY